MQCQLAINQIEIEVQSIIPARRSYNIKRNVYLWHVECLIPFQLMSKVLTTSSYFNCVSILKRLRKFISVSIKLKSFVLSSKTIEDYQQKLSSSMFAFMEKRCHVGSYKQLAKVNTFPPPQWLYRDKHLLKRFQRCRLAVGRELSIIKRRAKSEARLALALTA